MEHFIGEILTGVYKITSPAGKVYIGQTVDWFRRNREYSNMNNSKQQTKLHRSFQKYGIDSHEFTFIEKCDTAQLNERERYWQDYYNVVEKGLNCRTTTCNDKSGYLCETTKKAISKKLIGIPKSEDHIRKLTKPKKNNTNSLKNTPSGRKGVPLSEEHKANIRQSKLGTSHSEETRKKISNTKKGVYTRTERGKELFREKIAGKPSKCRKQILDIGTGIHYESLTKWMIETGKSSSVFYRLQREQRVKYIKDSTRTHYNSKKDFL